MGSGGQREYSSGSEESLVHPGESRMRGEGLGCFCEHLVRAFGGLR